MTTLKIVDFWPRSAAEAYEFTSSCAVISITDPGQAPARIVGSDIVLRLAFFDLVDDIGHRDFPPEKLFSCEQARALGDFVSDIQRASGVIACVVHCEAGISRSAAVALVVEALTGCPFPKRDSASLANTRVLRFCEAELGVQVLVPALKEEGGILLFGNS